MSASVVHPAPAVVRSQHSDANERPFIVIWESTRACPLACVHCRATAQPDRNPTVRRFRSGRREGRCRRWVGWHGAGGVGEAAGSMAARTDLDDLDREERLIQFADDFPRLSGARFAAEPLGEGRWRMTLRDAMEFLTTKDYVNNWLSECHERFCDLTAADWRELLGEAGFELAPGGGPWRNDWLVANRFAPSAKLLDAATGAVLDWPDTHILTIACRPPLG